MLAGLSELEILNYRMMTNTRTIAVMKFLARLQTIALLVKPALQSIMILKMVQITITEGKAAFYFKHNACLWTVDLSNNFCISFTRSLPLFCIWIWLLGIIRCSTGKDIRRAPIRFTRQVFIEQARCKRIGG
jgi:hypothetical protein